jgi:hypothetical protein
MEPMEFDQEDSVYTWMTGDHIESLAAQVSTKVPPGYDGRTSWFAYEEAIDDWVDFTTLEADKRGPALKNRLVGDAAVYKPLLDRDALKDAQNGVQYFKDMLRQHFVKGPDSVFLYRFFHLVKANRGAQDFLRWIGRFAVSRKRCRDAWMDTLAPPGDPATNQEFLAMAARENVNPRDPDVWARYCEARAMAFSETFPLNRNLLALIFLVNADLTQQQR